MASDVQVLNGIRVVEMTVWVAGPSAGGIMADWGADVVKVEPPSGDPQRDIYKALGYRDDLPNPSFGLDNRGKRSVVLDLLDEPGRSAMERLLATADVFLTNMRPAALEKLGLDAEEVTARHPSLVYTTITGYGIGGEESWRPGYDIGAFWARPGLARNMAPRDAPPVALRSGIGDHTTGITALAGTMGALVERARTGKGRVVEASLLRTGVYVNGWDTSTQLNFGRLESAKPRDNAPIPLVNSYEAGDGRWFWLIGLEADRHFPGLLAAIERPDLADDERFADAKARKANNQAFIAELDEVFAAQPLEHWAERFDAHDVWWAPAQSMAEVVEDPQLHAVGAFIEIENPGGDPIPSVNSPITFRGSPLQVGRPIPRLGEHTDEVLAELGLEP